MVGSVVPVRETVTLLVLVEEVVSNAMCTSGMQGEPVFNIIMDEICPISIGVYEPLTSVCPGRSDIHVNVGAGSRKENKGARISREAGELDEGFLTVRRDSDGVV